MFAFTFEDVFTGRIVKFMTDDWHRGLERAEHRSVDGLCVAKDVNRNVQYYLDFNSRKAKTYSWMYV